VKSFYGDTLVDMLRSAGQQVELKELDCIEASKTLSQVERVCAWVQEAELGRNGVLVSLGGGVCTDIVKMAASLARRGISFICVPTTLIGQVDAGIGIKGAINFGGMKSYLGCFYPPTEVLIAPTFLQSLPQNRLREGFAEIVKMAIVRDTVLMDLIETYGLELMENQFQNPTTKAKKVLLHSIMRMIEELEVNFYEDQTYERLVDFGHTFSPILEEETKHELSHGQAVAVDIALSTVLSGKLGILDIDCQEQILSLMKSLNLPIWVPELTLLLCRKALRKAALHRCGHPNLVLPTRIGEAVFLKDINVLSDTMLEEGIQLLAEMAE
jgi:3-dehydroquinate synthase